MKEIRIGYGTWPEIHIAPSTLMAQAEVNGRFVSMILDWGI